MTHFPPELRRLTETLRELAERDRQRIMNDLRRRVRLGVEMSEIEGLPPKLAAVLCFCRTKIIENGESPTVREVMAEFGIGLATAHYHLKRLRHLKLIPEPGEFVGLNVFEGQFLFDLIDAQERKIKELEAKRG